MENVLLIIIVICAAIFALRRGVPGLFCSQGYAHQDRGEYEAAEQWFLKALSFEKATQKITSQRRGVAIVCTNLGLLYHHQRRIDEAAKMLTTAIDIYSDLGRVDDSAPVYGSLGKLYFDNGDLQLAEDALNKALTIYRRRLHAQEAIDTTTALLDLISERRQNTDEPSKYMNTEYGFSFIIPAGWVKQRLVQQFSSTGGQVAISHKTHSATFNVSVGPPDRPEWRAKEARARAAREYLANAPGRSGSVAIATSMAVGGEPNTVSAEYETETDIRGVTRRRRDGLISIIHNELEYALQWSAERDLEEQAKGIIDSFKFKT